MSPQQITGERATHLDDIYSMGATIFELLTGKPPFYSGDITDQIKSKVPESMSQRRTDLGLESGHAIPSHWEDTIRSCLAKGPRDRPQQAAEIILRLGLIRGDPPSIATVVPPAIPPPRIVPPTIPGLVPPVTSGRRNVSLIVVSSAVIIGLIVISFALLSGREAKTPERSAAAPPSPSTSLTPTASANLTESARKVQPPAEIPSVTPELRTTTTAVQPPAPVPETRAPITPTTMSPPASSGPGAEEQFPETRTRLLTQDEVRQLE